MDQKLLTNTSAAEFRLHVKVLQVDARPAEERREIVEEQGETRRGPVVLGDQDLRELPLPEEVRPQSLLRRDDLMGEVLVLRELADKREDERDVLPGGFADQRSGHPCLGVDADELLGDLDR